MESNLAFELNPEMVGLCALFEQDTRILGVFLFGSRLEGYTTPQSDIDLGVV